MIFLRLLRNAAKQIPDNVSGLLLSLFYSFCAALIVIRTQELIKRRALAELIERKINRRVVDIAVDVDEKHIRAKLGFNGS